MATSSSRSALPFSLETENTRPFGYLAMMQAIYYCVCGAPFDLEVTPVFAGLVAESGLAWPPTKPINFPLKDW